MRTFLTTATLLLLLAIPLAAQERLSQEQLEAIAIQPASNWGRGAERVIPEMLALFKEEKIDFNGKAMKFRLHVPENLEPGKKYPMILWLHGAGETGDDNKSQLIHLHHIITSLTGEKKRDFFLIVPQEPSNGASWRYVGGEEDSYEAMRTGIPQQVKSGRMTLEEYKEKLIADLQNAYGGREVEVTVKEVTGTHTVTRTVGGVFGFGGRPVTEEVEETMLSVFVKLNYEVSLDFAFAMVDQVVENYPVDTNRITVSGLSTGGDGTWRALERRPDLFAAGVPLANWIAFTDKGMEEFPILKKIPVWSIYSSDDNGIDRARAEFDRVEKAGANVRKTEFGICGHTAWTPAMLQADIFAWLLSRAKDGDRFYAVYDPGVDPDQMKGIVDVATRDPGNPTLAPEVAAARYPGDREFVQIAVNSNPGLREATQTTRDAELAVARARAMATAQVPDGFREELVTEERVSPDGSRVMVTRTVHVPATAPVVERQPIAVVGEVTNVLPGTEGMLSAWSRGDVVSNAVPPSVGFREELITEERVMPDGIRATVTRTVLVPAAESRAAAMAQAQGRAASAQALAPEMAEARASADSMENSEAVRQQLDAVQVEMWDLVDSMRAARDEKRAAILARLNEAISQRNAMENALIRERMQAQPPLPPEPPSEYIVLLRTHADIISALRAADASVGLRDLREVAMAKAAELVAELTDEQKERMFVTAQARASRFVPPQRDPNEVFRTGHRPLEPGAQLVGIETTPERIAYRLISPDGGERTMYDNRAPAPIFTPPSPGQIAQWSRPLSPELPREAIMQTATAIAQAQTQSPPLIVVQAKIREAMNATNAAVNDEQRRIAVTMLNEAIREWNAELDAGEARTMEMIRTQGSLPGVPPEVTAQLVAEWNRKQWNRQIPVEHFAAPLPPVQPIQMQPIQISGMHPAAVQQMVMPDGTVRNVMIRSVTTTTMPATPPSPERDHAYARLAENYFVMMERLQRHVTQLESEIAEGVAMLQHNAEASPRFQSMHAIHESAMLTQRQKLGAASTSFFRSFHKISPQMQAMVISHLIDKAESIEGLRMLEDLLDGVQPTMLGAPTPPRPVRPGLSFAPPTPVIPTYSSVSSVQHSAPSVVRSTTEYTEEPRSTQREEESVRSTTISAERIIEECNRPWAMTTESLYGMFAADWDKEATAIPDFVVNSDTDTLAKTLAKSVSEDPESKDFIAACRSILSLTGKPMSSPWFETSGGRLRSDIQYSLSPKGQMFVRFLRVVADSGNNSDKARELSIVAGRTLEKIELVLEK
ncbi:MAG: hypothetical protein FWE95_09480 [Planctomycetaceae bacterium]|nr:hypothetical protein [Planctomycetaceae bacterium]